MNLKQAGVPWAHFGNEEAEAVVVVEPELEVLRKPSREYVSVKRDWRILVWRGESREGGEAGILLAKWPEKWE